MPLLAGTAVFLFVVATSQVALWAMGTRLDREAARLGRVYLDGLSAAVLPAIRAGDEAALEAAMSHALGFQEGIRERRIVIGTPTGERLSVAGIGPDPDWPPPFVRGLRGHVWEFSPDGDSVWAQRPLVDGDRAGVLVAAHLDISPIVERRQRLELALVAFGLALAILGGGFSALAARRSLQPVLVVTEALRRAGSGHLAPIGSDDMPPPDTEAGRLSVAFNKMTAHLAEREDLAGRLADRERAAVLGRLAATVAHEVRNPLAGMLTALETARAFGDDRSEREEALEVLERGLQQIERVVSSTLAVHRDGGPPRPLVAADLEDLRVLVAPAARRRGVVLDWRVALPEFFGVDAPRLRQAVLNLLLNAVAASPPGGRIVLHAQVEANGDLEITVEDSGAGLPPSAHGRLGLAAGSPSGAEDGRQGLGLEVVADIAQRLSARITAEGGGPGARVTLRVPPNDQAFVPPCREVAA
ncbi:sensor histidine kinase [Falsiroseomonas sp.]|uniref:sensor histidine kinase n=1 Tax=Falsiroseomonas sp. TaxID=2870721 RepID=UPI0035656CA4